MKQLKRWMGKTLPEMPSKYYWTPLQIDERFDDGTTPETSYDLIVDAVNIRGRTAGEFKINVIGEYELPMASANLVFNVSRGTDLVIDLSERFNLGTTRTLEYYINVDGSDPDMLTDDITFGYEDESPTATISTKTLDAGTYQFALTVIDSVGNKFTTSGWSLDVSDIPSRDLFFEFAYSGRLEIGLKRHFGSLSGLVYSIDEAHTHAHLYTLSRIEGEDLIINDENGRLLRGAGYPIRIIGTNMNVSPPVEYKSEPFDDSDPANEYHGWTIQVE